MMLDIVESRYDRQERISWWDQARLRAARVLVIGAGALGNEIVKNLALVGVGGIDIVDMDAIEHTNLARCALFRDADAGRWKAEALAEAAMRLNPDVTARSFVCRVQELGSAWLDDYDVVLAGLDSREARLWVNAACRRLGKPWIDGAIEGLQGIVRMFDAQGACYDCTLGEAERAVISHRRSCALLSPEEIVSGRTRDECDDSLGGRRVGGAGGDQADRRSGGSACFAGKGLATRWRDDVHHDDGLRRGPGLHVT